MKKKYNRRKWLNGYPDCDAFVIVAMIYDTQEDEMKGYVEINLSERGPTEVHVYGGLHENEVVTYMKQLDDLIITLQGAKEWIHKLQGEALEKAKRKAKAMNK